ncbi:metal-dependent amidase/aminoacylase/carboxypeptidase [Acephala macrosclerotiorum]|nr:metal-dependent amidase/aminoacylase/carboxypeptidase [Acephala macrosclerotiorum]
MTQIAVHSAPVAEYQEIINKSIDDLDSQLHDINRKIHENPELGYEEHKAHDNVVAFLRAHGLAVTPHAFGLETSFVCDYGKDDGPVVAFNVEYDALPGIGHACGHNLIATGSVAAFLGTVAAMKKYNLPGKARCLGTPAEEGGGGKIKLIDAGAYKGVSATFMTHPFSTPSNITYGTCMASAKFRATFTGKPAHAAAAPHEGINALDAAVLAYNGTSMLRQQIKPDQRIQGVMIEGGYRANIITPKSILDYNVRGATLKETKDLQERVVKCFEGAAIATGCKVEFLETNTYADLRPSRTLCLAYSEVMKSVAPEDAWPVPEKEEPGAYSTDQGNVSYVVPSFHGLYAIPIKDNAANHTPGFTDAAGTDEAHRLTLLTSKGMAGVAVKVLTDEVFTKKVEDGFKAWLKAQE